LEGIFVDGKEMIIFYDDGTSVAKKIGTIISKDNNFIVIRIEDKDVSIPIGRIVRMEEINDEQK
jgi:hypothetical protein